MIFLQFIVNFQSSLQKGKNKTKYCRWVPSFYTRVPRNKSALVIGSFTGLKQGRVTGGASRLDTGGTGRRRRRDRVEELEEVKAHLWVLVAWLGMA